jgi:hypothetical protein
MEVFWGRNEDLMKKVWWRKCDWNFFWRASINYVLFDIFQSSFFDRFDWKYIFWCIYCDANRVGFPSPSSGFPLLIIFHSPIAKSHTLPYSMKPNSTCKLSHLILLQIFQKVWNETQFPFPLSSIKIFSRTFFYH